MCFYVSALSNPPNHQPWRPLFVPGSAEVRVAVKAARLGSLRSCSSAPFGVLRIACDSPAFPPRPPNGHRGRHWGGLIIGRTLGNMGANAKCSEVLSRRYRTAVHNGASNIDLVGKRYPASIPSDCIAWVCVSAHPNPGDYQNLVVVRDSKLWGAVVLSKAPVTHLHHRAEIDPLPASPLAGSLQQKRF
jgi:hypothetical protein